MKVCERNSFVHGYHCYKDAVIGEEWFIQEREPDNKSDIDTWLLWRRRNTQWPFAMKNISSLQNNFAILTLYNGFASLGLSFLNSSCASQFSKAIMRDKVERDNGSSGLEYLLYIENISVKQHFQTSSATHIYLPIMWKYFIDLIIQNFSMGMPPDPPRFSCYAAELSSVTVAWLLNQIYHLNSIIHIKNVLCD